MVGCEEERCRELNKAFVHRVLRSRPFGYLHLDYSAKAFTRPSTESFLASEGGKILSSIDAVVMERTQAIQDLDLPATVVRVLLCEDLSQVGPVDETLWAREDIRRVVLTR